MRDITFGQYVNTRSPMHRLDPRIKLVCLALEIAFLFVAGNFPGLAVMALPIFLGMLFSGVSFWRYFRSMRGILVLVAVTALFNIFSGDGTPLVSLGFLHITMSGIRTAVFVTARVMLLVLSSTVLTFTTTPTQLTDALERVLRPLRLLHVPVSEISMMMTIAIRFIPTLFEEMDKIMQAQKSRGADIGSGGPIKRIRSLIPVIVPLFVSAFRRAYELATAMESRCYVGGNSRTRMHTLRVNLFDLTVLAFDLACCAGALLFRILITDPLW